MGSDYQFPQSLSLSEFNKVRDPSFSAYLNDADVQHEVKLPELGRGASSVGEIGVFRADKYFNQGLETEEMPKESVLRRSAVNMVSSPVRSKISLGTRSESSSKNSQTALLQSLPSQMVPGRHSTGEVLQQKRGFLSHICCRCSCVSKKSLNIEDRHFNSQEKRSGSKSNMNLADQLLEIRATPPRKQWTKDSKMILYPSLTPPLLSKAIGSPVLSENPSPNLHKNGIQDSLSPPTMGNIKKSTSLERELNLLNWDSMNTKLDDGNIASIISVEYYTDDESDASSDLFEIDSSTGQRKQSFSSQIPDSNASGYATPTTCYAPSEASIDWSVITASVAEFSNMSDCEDFKPPKPVPIIQSNKHAVTEILNHNNVNSSSSLQGCRNHKVGRVLETMDLHKTMENKNHHQRMYMDQFVPLSAVQSQASSQPLSVVKASFRQAI